MKVKVRAGKVCFSLRLPLRVCLWALSRADGEEALLCRQERKKALRILKEAKRTFGELLLVRAESASGEEVSFIL